MEFFQERAVCFCGDELVDHIDGSGKKDFDVGITGGIGDTFCKEGLTGTWVTDEDHVFELFDKIKVKKVEDVSFLIFS